MARCRQSVSARVLLSPPPPPPLLLPLLLLFCYCVSWDGLLAAAAAAAATAAVVTAAVARETPAAAVAVVVEVRSCVFPSWFLDGKEVIQPSPACLTGGAYPAVGTGEGEGGGGYMRSGYGRGVADGLHKKKVLPNPAYRRSVIRQQYPSRQRERICNLRTRATYPNSGARVSRPSPRLSRDFPRSVGSGHRRNAGSAVATADGNRTNKKKKVHFKTFKRASNTTTAVRGINWYLSQDRTTTLALELAFLEAWLRTQLSYPFIPLDLTRSTMPVHTQGRFYPVSML